MSQRARVATSLLAAAAIAVIVALGVIGTVGGPGKAASAACGAATDATYLSTVYTVARGISVGERVGSGVKAAEHTIETDTVLADAVATDDLATVRSEVVALVYNHEHIVRLRVLRDGRVLDDFGGPLVLAPVRGSLRVDGRVVGSFVMSVQDDAGYRKLVARLAGADSVMRYDGRTIMSDIAVAAQRLANHSAVSVRGVRYLVASLRVGRFPAGTLNVWLLVAAPAAALARVSCGQVRADVLADVAKRAYEESLSGPPVVPALTTLAGDKALPQELAAGAYAGLEQIVRGIVAGGGFAGLRVLVHGRVVADAGHSIALLAPLSRPIVDAAGEVVGTAQFAVQNAAGYVLLAGALTRVAVLVRSARRQLAGSLPGPRRLPASGPVSYRGVRYDVASFPAASFPSGLVRIYVLSPA